MSYFDEFLQCGKELIAIPSVQEDAVDGKPFGEGVAKCLDYTLDLAKRMGFRTKNNGYYYGYAEIGEGDLFGILGHLDVVPFGEGWSVSPTGGEVIDGVLYGRGVLDDKLPILSTLFAVKELVDEGLVPNKRIRIIFGCNEESGWECIKKYVECEEMPVAAISPDSDFPVIFAEKGVVHFDVTMPKYRPILSVQGGDRVNMVMDRCKATLVADDSLKSYLDLHHISYVDNEASIDVSFDGVSAHGSTPDKGVNALHKLLKVLSDVYADNWQSLYDKITDITGKGVHLDISDEVSGALSMNAGTISSNDDSMTISLDIRYPISYKQAYIYDTIANAMPDSTIKITGEHDPLYAPKDSELVKCLLDAYNEYTGENAEPIAIGGATYARALKNAVAFGPMFPDRESTIHQKDERVSLQDLENMYNIYLLALRKLCFN